MNEWDFIIVGAGSAGCALAYRLSENPKFSVLLIEAGRSDDHFLIHMPLGFSGMFDKPAFDWCFSPELRDDRPEKPRRWIRGKMLGGCSSINGMVYIRSQPRDHETWVQQGCSGWSWDEVLPVYRAMENHELGADTFRGAGGPLDVSCMRDHLPLCDAWIAAAHETGLPVKNDLNHGGQEGVGYFPRTIHRGRRVSAATAFLDRCRHRPNLKILTQAHVSRVMFEGDADSRRAVGVECRIAGSWTTLRAARETILSAGAINSPALLQLSGIGPASLLNPLGIELLRDAPGVGANLQEHFNAGCVHAVRKGSLNAQMSGLNLLKQLGRYLLFRDGPMAMAAAQVGAFMRTRPGLDHPNAQWHMGPLRVADADGSREEAEGKVNLKLAKIGGFTSFGCALQPTPNGGVSIASNDPLAAPRIRYRHLVSEQDQRTIVEIIRLTRRIAEQPALREFGVEEVSPGPEVQRDEDLLEHAHRSGGLGFHPVGTCKMGRDTAVVDPLLKVYGVRGLRVADASIMPVMPSGNTNAAAMMIGWKAGDLILHEHRR